MTEWIRNHLVPEATEWWRLWSARLIVAALTIDALSISPIIGMLPEEVRAINPAVFDAVQMALVVCALFARVIKQPEVTAKVAAKVEARSAAAE